jgi:ABC-type spermidine/putrescine transport system permease subunit I
VSRRRGGGRDLLLPLTLPELLLAVAGFLAPLALLVAYAFGEADYLTFDVAVTGTLDSFRKLFSPVYRPVLVRSALLAAVTVAACTVIGTPAALAIARLPHRQARAVLLAVIAPAFVSFTVRVHAWSNLLSSEGLVERLSGQTLLFTPGGVALGMIGTYIPLFILPVVLALGRIEPGVVEAAADLGAPPWRRTWTVVLPLAAAGIVTGAVLVGVLAIGEYIVPTVLGGGRVLLLGNLLNDQAGGRDQPLGGAIAVVILITMAFGAVLSRLGGRRAA